MIDNFTLTEDYVQFYDSFSSWEEAIRKSSKPLLENDLIQPSYIDAMIQNINDNGPYIVIAPFLAIPHAAPGCGGDKVGYAITIVKQPVYFSEKHTKPARLFITISCVTPDTHLAFLQKIGKLFLDETVINRLLETKDKQQIISIIEGKK